ncbi:MAG: aminomethyl-transferring glycine dehydrogenase subunit GcvPB [Dehalococcoidia bacterium]
MNELERPRPLLIETSQPGRIGCDLPASDVPTTDLPSDLLRDDLALPELSQLDVVRHFTRLSQLNYSIDTNFFPLGSCTMKYNPRVHEDIARMAGFADLHPQTDDADAQGALQLMYELQEALAELVGMDAVSLTPAAGAQGELTGILLTRAYHESRGEGEQRRRVVIPDSAHGTNPATAAMAGYTVSEVHTDENGDIDIEKLKEALGPDVAAFMLTLPNTLGLFEPEIIEIAEIVHEAGALLYMDGANFNALAGRVSPGALGVDIMHFNLHKTFSTPHGGGGPGAGPVAVRKGLGDFLPGPIAVEVEDGTFRFEAPSQSIGRLSGSFGNFGVILRAYSYLRTLGDEGLREASEAAVVNANYLLSRLREAYDVPFNRSCMHEALITGRRQRNRNGVKTLDIAKRLLDYGFYAPTVYFPLVVDEAMLIEPTESESKESIDAFCDALLAIAREAEENPELVQSAPHLTPVRRLDEATAARKPILHW